MRRINYLAMAVILATMVGCQKDDELLNVQNNIEQTFYATFENGADTRTALDGSNNVIWSDGDQISVFSGTTANNAFILNDGVGTTYGKFTVNSLAAGTESNGSVSTLSANVAYYPYNNNVTVSESNGSYTFNATFPATQTYSASGTFGNGASPMVAVTSSTLDANLKFKNVGAIFRLQLKGSATITKIVFNADANLAGDCAITASNTLLPTVNISEGSNTIILDCGDGAPLSDEPTNFIVSMLPIENVTGGITITIYDNAGKKMVYTYKENESISIERSKAYSTEEVEYNGNEDANTPDNVQDALDAATSGTTIQLEPGEDYGTLYIRPVEGRDNTTTTNSNYTVYSKELLRKVENLTIVGAHGAKVDAIEVPSGYIEEGGGCGFVDIKNLVVKSVEFTDKYKHPNTGHTYSSPIFISLAHTNVDGLTVENCKLEGDNDKMNFVYFYGSQQSTFTTAAKNITITGNTVDGIARLCELREAENVTITNNTIKNTYLHGILLAVNSGATYSGDVTITGNTADGINDRFVRMAGAGDANVEINDNVITNYKGADADCIKVTGRTTGTIDTKKNRFEVSTTETLQAALDAATKGTIIDLVPNVNYGVIYMGRPTKYNNTKMLCKTDNYTTNNAESFKTHLADGQYHTTPRYTTTLKNLTVNGATGATIEGLVATSGHIYGDVYDYVLEKDYTSGSAYYLTLNIENVVFSKVNFTGKIDINTSDENSVYDGITFDYCTFTTGGTASGNGAAIRYYNEANNSKVKNVEVKNCTFTNCYQGVYVHHVNGITVTSSHFTTTGHNAIAVQNHDGAVALKNVVLTNNDFKNIGDRIIRFGDIGADSNITIQGNSATNSGDENKEVMKATTIASGVITSISGNNWGTDAVVANEELKDK